MRRAVLFAVPLGLALTTPVLSANFFEVLFGLEPARPAPVFAPREYGRSYHSPRRFERTRRIERVRVERQRREQRPAAEAAAAAVPSISPKAMGQIDNPFPKLMTDTTLRAGDIVVFPDGPRVFKGQPGAKHTVADFAALTNGNASAALRKVLAGTKVGINDAWSQEPGPSNKLAGADVDTTGSLRRRARR